MRGLESAINGRCGRRRCFWALLVGGAGVGAGEGGFGCGVWPGVFGDGISEQRLDISAQR